MDVRDETSGKTGMQQWNRKPRLKTVAMSEERDNRQQHQRTKQEARATSGKQDNSWQDLQEDCSARGSKANSRDFH
jgi:hypothetical protein